MVEKEKLLLTSNLSFSDNFFYSFISLERQNVALRLWVKNIVRKFFCGSYSVVQVVELGDKTVMLYADILGTPSVGRRINLELLRTVRLVYHVTT